MASPSAAGAAALIMQYFRDYRFWAKNCNSIYWFCKPIFPSGRMVKAILLHSGTGMTKKHGISADLDQYLGDPPDNVQASINSSACVMQCIMRSFIGLW